MHFSLRCSVLLLPALALCAEPQAPDYSRASILGRAPFAKPDKGGKPVVSGPIELRGFYGTGAGLEVSLMRAGTAESAWVRVGDKDAKWFVESADPVAGTADVRYDGLTLRLKLARPEEPELTVKPAAPAPGADGEARGSRRGGWGDMSPATRDILRKSMRDSMETLRKSNPEYFDGTPLSDEQRKAFAAVREAGFAKVREEVAKAAPEDLPKIDEMRKRMEERMSRPRQEPPAPGADGAAKAAPSGDAAKATPPAETR